MPDSDERPPHASFGWSPVRDDLTHLFMCSLLCDSVLHYSHCRCLSQPESRSQEKALLTSALLEPQVLPLEDHFCLQASLVRTPLSLPYLSIFLILPTQAYLNEANAYLAPVICHPLRKGLKTQG